MYDSRRRSSCLTSAVYAMSETNRGEVAMAMVAGRSDAEFSVVNALDSAQRRRSAKGTSFHTYGARLAAGNGRAHPKKAQRNVIAVN